MTSAGALSGCSCCLVLVIATCFRWNTNTLSVIGASENHCVLASRASQALSFQQVVLVMCQRLHIASLGSNVVLLEDMPRVLSGMTDIQQNS